MTRSIAAPTRRGALATARHGALATAQRGAIAALALAVALGAAGCVPSQRAVEAPVLRLVRDRVGAAPGDGDAAALLAQPLTRASTARLALAKHPRVAAALAQLGVAAGELGLARGLGRTELGAGVKLGAEPSVEVEVLHDVIDLIVAAPRRAAGDADLAAAQARAGAALIALVARADGAFLDVAAAAEQLALARTGFDTVTAAAELTLRVHGAGGTTDLALARAQAARETARLDVARAELAVEAARTGLDAAVGLTGDDTRWRLGEALPALPDGAPALDGLEVEAVTASLELVALTADQTAQRNGARAASIASWLPGLALGVAVEQSDHGTSVGPALHLGLPILSGDRGAAAAARARGRASAHLVTAVAIETRAAARAARLEALGAFAEARQLRDVIVPLHRRVLDETVLQYNAMNASPFELLVARRDLATAEQALVAARHRFARAMVAIEALRRGATIDPRGSSAPSSSLGASSPAGH